MRILIAVVVMFFVLSCNQTNRNSESTSEVQAEAVMHEEVLSIGKMHCEMCVTSVEKGLNSVEGVEFVKVNLEDSTAFVRYDGSKTNQDELRKAIERRGYVLKNK